jgi:hypothetical protein
VWLDIGVSGATCVRALVPSWLPPCDRWQSIPGECTWTRGESRRLNRPTEMECLSIGHSITLGD